MAERQQYRGVEQLSQKKGVKNQVTNSHHQSSTIKSCHESMTKNDSEIVTDFVMPQSEADGKEHTGVSLKHQNSEELQIQKISDNEVICKSLNTQSSTAICYHELMKKKEYDSVVQTAINFAIAQSKTAIDFARSQELSRVIMQNHSELANKEATNYIPFQSTKNKSCDESNVKKADKPNTHSSIDFTIPESKEQCLEVGGLQKQNLNEGILTITSVQLNPLNVKSCYIPMWETDCDSMLDSAVKYFMSQNNAKRQEYSGVKQQNQNAYDSNATIQLLPSSEKSSHELKDKNGCDSTVESGIDYAKSYNNKESHKLAGFGLQNHNEAVHKQVSNSVALKSSIAKSCHQFMEKNICVNEFKMLQNSDLYKKLSGMEVRVNNDDFSMDSAINFVMRQTLDTNEGVDKMAITAVEVRSSSIISCHKTISQNWDDFSVHSTELRKVFKELGVVFSTLTLRKESNYSLYDSTSSFPAMLQIKSSLLSRQLFCTSFLLRRRVSNISPQEKAKRIKFFRNGDKYSDGIVIPVSKKKYNSLEILLEDLTKMFSHYNSVVSRIFAIYSMCGQRIKCLNELENLNSYVCALKNECFKSVSYKGSLHVQVASSISAEMNKHHLKRNSPIKMSLSPSFPQTVTLIKGGFKPRMLLQLPPNTLNCSTFEKVVESISNLFGFDSRRVPKIYTLSGMQVNHLSDFISGHSIFFVFMKRPIPDDFLLHTAEVTHILTTARNLLKSASTTGPNMLKKDKKKRADCSVIGSKTNECRAVFRSTEEKLPADIRENYLLQKVIGRGSYSVVLKITNRYNLETLALKVIDKNKYINKAQCYSEVRILKKLDHPNIVSLKMEYNRSDLMYLLFEYIQDGDLFDVIQREKKLSEDQTQIIIKQLACGLLYLHSKNIIHRDIKPENLLVVLGGQRTVKHIKLTDFSLVAESTELQFEICGTPAFVAPEIVERCGYHTKVDIWSAGIIVYLLLSGNMPLKSVNAPLYSECFKERFNVKEIKFPVEHWTDISDGAIDLIKSMLQFRPALRLTSEQVLNHHWITK